MDEELKSRLERLMAAEEEREQDMLCEQLCSLSTKYEEDEASVKKAALVLWNKTLLTAMSDGLKARVRHTAMRILFKWGTRKHDLSANDMSLQLEVGVKTGQTLEACGKRDQADIVWSLSWDAWLRLCDTQAVTSLPEKIVRLGVKLLTLRAESSAAGNNFQQARACVSESTSILSHLPDWTPHFSHMLYNMAVIAVENLQFDQAVEWLSQSYQLLEPMLEQGTSSDSAHVGRVLCLHAWIMVQRREHSQALNVLALASRHTRNETVLRLRLDALLALNASDGKEQEALGELLEHNGITITAGIRAIQDYMQARDPKASIQALESALKILRGHASSGEDQTRVNVCEMLVLIKTEQLSRLQSFADLIASDEAPARSSIAAYHSILWTHAARLYHDQHWEKALALYRASATLSLSHTQQTDAAKLHCNMSWCLLHLSRPVDALECAFAAVAAMPGDPRSLYVLFKASLQAGKRSEAMSALARLCAATARDDNDIEEKNGFLCLAVKDCFEAQARSEASMALEGLSDCAQDLEQLTLLRCLVRLRLSFLAQEEPRAQEHIGVLKGYLQKAHQGLAALAASPSPPVAPRIEEEAEWFAKVCWNLGIRCGNVDDSVLTFAFFNLCLMFDKVQPMNKTLPRRKMSAFLAASALTTQAAAHLGGGSRVVQLFEQALTLSRESRLYLASCNEGDPQLERLISLVDFHALAGLRKPQSELEKFIENLKQMDNMASTLKIVAGFAMQYGYQEAAYQALQAASRASPVGASLQANCIWHDLVKLTADLCRWEEVASLFQAALGALEERRMKVPLTSEEILWCLTASWNKGVDAICRGLQSQGLALATIGLKFVEFLEDKTLRDSYRDRLLDQYDKIAKM